MKTQLSWLVLAVGCLSLPAQGEEASLPSLSDVREVMQGHQAQAAAIQQRAATEMQALRARTIEQLQAVQDKYTRAAQLDETLAVREQIRRLQRENGHVMGIPRSTAVIVPSAAAHPALWRNRVGQSYLTEVTGSSSGSLWGSDVYTDDSDLGTAAAHAGVLAVGQRGVVRVTILGPGNGFQGVQRNVVTSSSWSSWDGSFRVESAGDTGPLTCLPDPGTLMSVTAAVGATLRFQVTGSTEGYVWGSDVYTTDSQIAAAAVHAGVLRPGETGRIVLTIMPGRASYVSSTRHGVTTHGWGNFARSFRVSRDESASLELPH